MKKILILLSAITLCGCVENATKTTKRIGEAQCRIIGKEYTCYEGYAYQIIEIDGQEYISPAHGGIYPLVKPIVKDTIE